MYWKDILKGEEVHPSVRRFSEKGKKDIEELKTRIKGLEQTLTRNGKYKIDRKYKFAKLIARGESGSFWDGKEVKQTEEDKKLILERDKLQRRLKNLEDKGQDYSNEVPFSRTGTSRRKRPTPTSIREIEQDMGRTARRPKDYRKDKPMFGYSKDEIGSDEEDTQEALRLIDGKNAFITAAKRAKKDTSSNTFYTTNAKRFAYNLTEYLVWNKIDEYYKGFKDDHFPAYLWYKNNKEEAFKIAQDIIDGKDVKLNQ
jgi:cell division protein FtsB